MMFLLCAMMIIFGFVITTIPSIMGMPAFTILFVMIGAIIAFVGLMMLYMRACKVGANYLIAPFDPNKILWLYITKDDIIQIFKVDRHDEQTLKSTDTDTLVYDMQSYRLGDHSVRLVVDSIGHTIDARMAIYAKVLQKIKQIPNLPYLRDKAREDGELIGQT